MAAPLSDEMFVAFLHGELDEIEIRRVEAAMAADPALELRIEALSRQDDDIRNAFGTVLNAPVPETLIATVNATQPEAEIIDIAARHERKAQRAWGWPQASAIAASLAIGLLAGWQGGNTPTATSEALVIASADGPRLAKNVETMLATVKSGELKSLAALGTGRVTISFQTADGVLCRQFAVEGSVGTTDGVACRESKGWRLHALGLRSGESGEIRMASGDAAPPVLASVDALIAGEPLDAVAETTALLQK